MSVNGCFKTANFEMIMDRFVRHLNSIDPQRTFLEKLDIGLKVTQSKMEDIEYEILNSDLMDPQRLKDLTNEMLYQEEFARRISKLVENNSRRSG
jgi:hypothetical protein